MTSRRNSSHVYRIACVAVAAVLAVSMLVFLIVGQNKKEPAYDHTSQDKDTSFDTGQTKLTRIETPSRKLDSSIDQLARFEDANHDSWETEQLTVRINGRLKQLAHLIQQPNSNSESAILSNDFRCDALRPASLQAEPHPGGFHVRRWDRTQLRLFERDQFSTALGDLKKPFGRPPIVNFKLFQIDVEKETRNDAHRTVVLTKLYFEAAAVGEGESVQQNATWNCRWVVDRTDEIKLAAIRLDDFQESRFSNDTQTLFTDSTASVLEQNSSYREQVLRGIPEWSMRISREFMTQFGHHGIAVGDVNGDDLDDIYVCDSGGLPNRLYVQQPDGTAVDVSADSGVNVLEDAVSSLLIDLDNDGDQDLAIATDPLIQLAENDGTGRFTLHRGYFANTDSYSMSAADYDLDGDLDIYVCGYNARKQDAVNRGLPFPLPYHDANNGGRNYLLRNEGDFVFADVTAQVGLDVNNRRFSLAAAWVDFDNDRDLDLYVANDFGRNCLYRNDGGRFVDVADQAGAEDHASGMSVACGDYNRDGFIDIYVSNMFSAAGNRVTYQRQFSRGLADQTVSHLKRMARGNTLFQGGSDATFRDVSETASVTMGRWAWGSRFVDMNNDGWQDLVVANGYVSNEDTSDL